MKFKLLSALLIFFISFACEQPELSKIDNIDEVLEHITEIEFRQPNTISGFHYYYPDSIERYGQDDIKVSKVNDTLWVVTKGNPDGYHTGTVLYISAVNKVHIYEHKSFFPSIWDEEILAKKISKIVTKVKSGDFSKIKCKKYGNGCSCIIDTILKSKHIKVLITYDNDMKNVKIKSIYPAENLDEVNISQPIINKIMGDQARKFFFNKSKNKVHQKRQPEPEPVVSQKPSCVIL